MDTQALIELAQFLLPTGPGPSLKHPTDLIALLIHAIQVAVNFRLDPPTTDQQSESQDDKEGDNYDTVSESDTAVGDDENDSSPARFPASLGITLEQALQSRLPRGWNSRGEDSYTFSYRHAQSSLGFVVKVGKIGGRVSVMGMVEVSSFRIFSCFL
jgi:proteasome inhibitor subunit 1 (PI31)